MNCYKCVEWGLYKFVFKDNNIDFVYLFVVKFIILVNFYCFFLNFFVVLYYFGLDGLVKIFLCYDFYE